MNRCVFRTWRAGIFIAAGVVGHLALGAAATAQEDSDAPAPAAEQPAETEAPAADSPAEAAESKQKYEQALDAFRQVVAEMAVLRNEWKTAEADRRAEIRRTWNELAEKGEALRADLLRAAEEAFVAAPNADPQLSALLFDVLFDDVRSDDFEEALRLGRLLIDHGAGDKRVYDLTGQAAFATSEFDLAETLFNRARDEKLLSQKGREYLAQLPKYKEAWTKEEALRQAEAGPDDLPRVLLRTNRGDIEIELFENEAPNTVANFVSLVEAGFYNGRTFHRVLPGFVAQGGCPQGDGRGGPGYTIACECYRPDHRLHFRGSLSMAHSGRDTGGSQFFITFVPTGHLDGGHTVFGRVIRGFEVLAKLQRRDPDDPAPPAPDRIVKAEVVRKRDHAYEPKTSGDEFNR
jgi:cyclophilin family peptidyl-prolyl cis-trans isomerase